ncbi:MAG TPA: VWA domain-containing protein [Candidatus Angelobacter sp.]|nr:VWA domain-containing protein [Candidatus Angelobacter sp.]
MRLIQLQNAPSFSKVKAGILFTAFASIAVFALLFATGVQAQSPTPAPTVAPVGDQNQQNTTGEAGGPSGDIGPIAVPKKKPEEPPRAASTPTPQKIEGLPNYTLHVSAQLVNVDVGVLTKEGMFVPGLKKENFRVLEDNVPQTITSFNQTQAPITAVMLVEFASNFYEFEIDAVGASYVFAQTLKKEDWVALISFDIKTRILSDFTQDKRGIFEGIRSLQIPMSSETNLFDALYDTIDRLETVEGRKYIILIASGRDTFSKHTLDQTLKKIQNSKDIAIYSVGTGQALRNWAESHGLMQYLCPITSFACTTEWAQADNQMRSFAKMTGGRPYFPLFQASFRDAFVDIANTIRNQYVLAYHPTNPAQDGSYRKIKVELVGVDGKPLIMRDEKHHDVKYQIVAREGYRAKREVE